MHSDAPAIELKVPPAQGEQVIGELLPLIPLKVPTAHAVQADAPVESELYVPAAHEVHTDTPATEL